MNCGTFSQNRRTQGKSHHHQYHHANFDIHHITSKKIATLKFLPRRSAQRWSFHELTPVPPLTQWTESTPCVCFHFYCCRPKLTPLTRTPVIQSTPYLMNKGCHSLCSFRCSVDSNCCKGRQWTLHQWKTHSKIGEHSVFRASFVTR